MKSQLRDEDHFFKEVTATRKVSSSKFEECFMRQCNKDEKKLPNDPEVVRPTAPKKKKKHE